MATEASILSGITIAAPSFRNPDDKIAFAVHAAFIAAGYSLIATGPAASVPNPPTDGAHVGIQGWNESDTYAFVYTKTVKGAVKSVLVKCVPVGNGVAVDVLDMKDKQEDEEKPISVQIKVSQHVKEAGDGPVKYNEIYKNLACLVENLNAGIFSKLEPTEEKIPAVAEGSSTSTSGERSEHVIPDLGYGPHPSGSGSIIYPPVPVGGYDDINQGHPAGFFYPRPGSGGPMLVGPNDPRWFGEGQQPGFPGGIPGVPPGARFDPYGPPDIPDFGPDRFIRPPPRRPGGGTHPDLEHFQGPNYF